MWSAPPRPLCGRPCAAPRSPIPSKATVACYGSIEPAALDHRDTVMNPIAMATVAIGVVLSACAPQRTGDAGSAFIRQEAISASTGGGNFDVAGEAGSDNQPVEQITDRTLVIGLSA